jgi:hypothetical protein
MAKCAEEPASLLDHAKEQLLLIKSKLSQEKSSRMPSTKNLSQLENSET